MKNTLLDTIKDPSDLRKLDPGQLSDLAEDLRQYIIEIVATKEGHLGASLGVVELTIALHYIFNTPDDMLVWDVGHQAYPHKLLTGRKDVFDSNRQLHGISGFPNREESIYDTFGTGHSSTSISAVLGMAMASRMQGNLERRHIAVIGDASIASGMAFEALNHAGVSKSNLLIILNDNAIGIDPSVGALKEYLTRVKKGEKDGTPNIIDALSINYSGPIDGHDLPLLLKELDRLKHLDGPQFLHLITTKGKGLKKAEEDQVRYHAPGRFDAKTGQLLPKDETGLPPRFQDVFGKTLTELAGYNDRITAITPAMPSGSSLNLMMKAYPNRAFDVGIAEQHAVTLAAGMATNGMIPFCNIYSTFLQRAYDQVIHDVALQHLPVVFCLDRAGLVGHDGPTHHGVFDIAYLRCIPNMIIFAPRNVIELRNILYTAAKGLNNPIAIRYPRGRGRITQWQNEFNSIAIGKADILKKGNRLAVVSTGTMAYNVKDALKHLNPEEQAEISHYDLRFIKPLDEAVLHEIFSEHEAVLTIEDGVISGGMGSALLEFAAENKYKTPVYLKGVPDNFIPHGSVKELHQLIEIDEHSLAQELRKILLT